MILKFERGNVNRRMFIQSTAASVCALGAFRGTFAGDQGVMFKNLGPGHIGIKVNQLQLIDLASRHGFGGVDVLLSDLEKMTAEQRAEAVKRLKESKLRWGPCGLPTDFRKGDQEFKDGMGKLPRLAGILKEIGASRVSTWLSPGHGTLTFLKNFEQHRSRLREIALVLKDNGIRFGLEYVGPKTSRDKSFYPFIHSQAEVLELISGIGVDTVGILLDSYHWHTSHGTPADLEKLTRKLVVDVHVNDAQPGIPTDELLDLKRALPGATGVIDLKSFITFLRKIAYDGPVSCEPFDQELNAMDDDAAAAKAKAALDATFSLAS